MNTTSMPQTHLFSIDTLQFSKRLQKAGMQKDVAEELAEALKENHSQSLEGLATKQDLFLAKQELQQEISLTRKELRYDLEMLRKDLTIKMGGMMTLGVSVIALLIKF